jgi:signal recognition particle receptor subunit beta
MMNAYKIVFSGPVGTGKTTAIAAISDIEPFQTEEFATDEVKDIKQNTTVAMDYGMMKLDNDDRIHLYGTPGQERFDFMWEILTEGGIGLVLLLNNQDENPLKECEKYLDAFADYIKSTGVTIGVTRMEVKSTPTIDDYHELLKKRNICAPVLEVDPRDANDVILLMQSLLYSIDPGLSQQDEKIA